MSNKQTVVSNLIWRFMERCGAQIVSFAVSIVLARLLAPELYGTIALVSVIITIMQVFVDSGMANALIQKKDTDELDYSTVFYFNLVFCLILYLGLFAAAPLISRIYDTPSLTPIVRVLGLTLIVSGIKNVQQAYVSKTLQFKRFFFATLGGTLLSAAVGIAMAYMGYGVWALVFQQLSNAAVNTAILWLTVGWRPKRVFSMQRLKGLVGYGWKLLASSLLDTVYNKVSQLIIGALYTKSDLAFYNRGEQMPSLLTENINSSIDSVLLPVLSAEQDHREQVRSMTRRAIRVSSFVMMPLMLGLAVCAEPLIRLLLTEKWLPCVPYLRIACAFYAFYPMHTANLNAIKAMGRSDLFLMLEMIKKAVGIGLLIISMRFGVIYIMYSRLVTCLAALAINAWPNRRLLDYPFIRQLGDMLPSAGIAAVMALCVYPVSLLGLSDPITLLIQVPLGAAVFAGVSRLFRLDSFDYVLSIIKKLVRRGKDSV